MPINLLKVAAAVRSSYWFVPSLMALLAAVFGASAVWVDAAFELSWLESFGWYQAVKASGAREVLSTIAGSMITVAGVVFSITILALSFASSQYGPRVLTNFMDDRGNKVTLGTFIATFVYCLVVLRTIRGGDDGGFVPQFAVLVGLGFALCSIGVLIYFIHHVPRAIHINHVVAGIGRQLIRGISAQFPPRGEPLEISQKQDISSFHVPRVKGHPIRARVEGYIQRIDESAILSLAERDELLVRLHCRSGDYVTPTRTVLEVWPRDRIGKSRANELADTLIVGALRTPQSDLRFLATELVEIAERALSPGVNDPVTAMTCIDWLGASLEALAQRGSTSVFRVGSSGQVRVIAKSESFATFVELSLGQLKGYAAGDPTCCVHLLRTIGQVAQSCRDAEQIASLQRVAAELTELARGKLFGPSLRSVEDEYRSLVREQPGGHSMLEDCHARADVRCP